jgi:transcriptional regulator with XRE-family HTH domain
MGTMTKELAPGSGIGARVRAARQRLGWTREALAFHAGVSWPAITQVETGRRTNLRPSTLVGLSRALGVSIDYLVGASPRPTMLEHSAFPYRTDDQFRTILGPYLAEGIERSEPILAVTTSPNIELLRDYLGKDARWVQFVESRVFYSTPAAALAGYKNFSEASLARGAAWARVLGEPLWTGRSDAEVRLWARYESLFNLALADSPLSVVCPYDERSATAEIVRQAHLTHPNVLSDQGISPCRDYAGPGRFALEADDLSAG